MAKFFEDTMFKKIKVFDRENGEWKVHVFKNLSLSQIATKKVSKKAKRLANNSQLLEKLAGMSTNRKFFVTGGKSANDPYFYLYLNI